VPQPVARRKVADTAGSSLERTSESCTPAFCVLYWGGSGEDCWDLDQHARTPRMFCRCDGITDSWRGRFENVQITLRTCAAEGSGFKSYVQSFLMLSAKATVQFHLPTFHKWSVASRKEVLTERVVLGTMLEVHRRQVSPGDCGVTVQNFPGAWGEVLRGRARQLQREAHDNGGKFAALLLDAHGRELRAAEMVEMRGRTRIERLLIVLGGPNGIHPGAEEDMRRVLEEFTDFPLLRCSLPGGLMHSYYALASLFVLHDQGVLLPFLSYLAEGASKGTTLAMFAPAAGWGKAWKSRRTERMPAAVPWSAAPPWPYPDRPRAVKPMWGKDAAAMFRRALPLRSQA